MLRFEVSLVVIYLFISVFKCNHLVSYFFVICFTFSHLILDCCKKILSKNKLCVNSFYSRNV